MPSKRSVRRAAVVAATALSGVVSLSEASVGRLWRACHAIGASCSRTVVRVVLADRTRTVLLGRRAPVSLLCVLLAPAVAVATAAWVEAVLGGFDVLEAMILGTWTGRGPSTTVFVATGVLLVGGAASAAANSGLVPTSVLVSLPDAVAVAAGAATVGGVALGLVAFLLGGVGRRIVRALRPSLGVLGRSSAD